MTTPIEPGQRFAWLTVVRQENTGTAGVSTRWLCRCACGAEKVVRATSLRAGHTTSCGCKRAGHLLDGRLARGHSKTRRHTVPMILDTDFDE